MKKLIVIICSVFILDSAGYPCGDSVFNDGVRVPMAFNAKGEGPTREETVISDYRVVALSGPGLKAEDLLGTPLCEAFGIVDNGKVFNGVIEVSGPEKTYNPEDVYSQFGKGFGNIDENEYIVIRLEIRFGNRLNYTFFIDTKENIKEIINGLALHEFSNSSAFPAEKIPFFISIDIKEDDIYLDLIRLNREDIKGTGIISKTIELLVTRVLSVRFRGMNISANVRHPATARWFEKYFKADVIKITFGRGATLDISRPNVSQRFFKILVDLQIFSEDEIGSILEEVESQVEIKKIVSLVGAIRAALYKKEEVESGQMSPWQYLLSQIQEKDADAAFLMRGVIPKPEELKASPLESIEQISNIPQQQSL